MGYIYYNPNPFLKSTGDCVVRALTKVLNSDWDTVYTELAAKGFELKEMPSTNNVWRAFLFEHGFERYYIPYNRNCSYSVREFCTDNPSGTFLLFVGMHVIAVVNGNYYDTFDSGNECPTFFWRKREVMQYVSI